MSSFFHRCRLASLESRRRLRVQLMLESLEGREVPATFTVTTLADGAVSTNGQLTLREAVNLVNADTNDSAGTPDVIAFAPGLNGAIALTLPPVSGNPSAGGELRLSNPVLIQGPGANVLAVRQTDPTSRVFEFAPTTGSSAGTATGANFTIHGLTITGGKPASGGGGGILSSGSLVLDGVEVTNNDAGAGDGGGVLSVNGTALAIRASTIAGNHTSANGGGVAIEGPGGTVGAGASIVNSTIDSNTAVDGGGVLVFPTDRTSISNSTITFNVATSPQGTGGIAQGNPGGPIIAIGFAGSGLVYNDVFINSDIIAGNTPIDLSSAPSAGVTNFIGNVLTSTGSVTNDISRLNLGALQLNNSGTTRTRALGPGSAAVNAGSNSLGLTTDQNGNPRVGPQGVDLGAVEAANNGSSQSGTSSNSGSGSASATSTGSGTGSGAGSSSGAGTPTLAQINAEMNQLIVANLEQLFTRTLVPGGPIIAAAITSVADVNGDGFADVSAVIVLRAGKNQVTVIRLVYDGMSTIGSLIGAPSITTLRT